MDDLQLHMISNLRPHTATNWRIKIRVTRMWQHMNGNAEIVGMSFIFADALVSAVFITSEDLTIQV